MVKNLHLLETLRHSLRTHFHLVLPPALLHQLQLLYPFNDLNSVQSDWNGEVVLQVNVSNVVQQ